jgi:pantoate--beta-alanine ligase
MLIFKKVADLRHWLDGQSLPVGFAPTMGALHNGHLELIRMAKNDGCIAVASIFVNPTQFNDPRDLEKYPRTPEKDAGLLIEAGCDVLFMPSVEEVYPPGIDLTIELDFGVLDKVMEGEFRPGHFKGMATVVNRLLDIVRPHKLYMGQKDYQQLSIVRDMIRQLSLSVELIMCPTVREPDGLAMSSRNVRLSPDMRAAAPVIHQTLQWAKTALEADVPRDEIKAQAMDKLRTAGLRPEYFELVDGVNLEPIRPKGALLFLNEIGMGGSIVACTAAFAGEVRLIDNLVLAP